MVFQVSRNGHTIQLDFDTVADLLVVRDLIDGWANTQGCIHTQTFEPGEVDLQRGWLMEARQLLDAAGMPYQVSERRGEVDIYFQSFGAMAMFGHLADTGYLDRKAEIARRLNGPEHP